MHQDQAKRAGAHLMTWLMPIMQMHEARRRIWRQSQQKRRAGLPYRAKMSVSEAARYAAIARWSRK